MDNVKYEQDIVVWANQQAAYIRAGRFELLDLEHIADEIEDVGKSEQRELLSRMGVLLAHLFKWQHQPDHQGKSWMLTIRLQREAIEAALQETPSLRNNLPDAGWQKKAWRQAQAVLLKDWAAQEALIECIPDELPYAVAQVLDAQWWPPTVSG